MSVHNRSLTMAWASLLSLSECTEEKLDNGMGIISLSECTEQKLANENCHHDYHWEVG